MIVIYSKDGCEFCEQAKLIMKNKNIAFEEKRLGLDFLREDVVKAYPSMRTYPVIVHDGRLVGGFTEFVTELNSGTSFGKILLQE